MKRRLPLLLLLLLALLPVSASAVGMVTEAKYDAGKLVLTAYADDDTVTVKNERAADIVLLLDMSSAMNQDDAKRLAQVKAAVTSFVNAIPNGTGEDRLDIITYAEVIKESTELLSLSEEETTTWSRFISSKLRDWKNDPNIVSALNEAKMVFEKDVDPAHDKIVILLYDSSATTTDAARTDAIAAAKVLKDDGVELFCVDYAAPDKAQTAFAADLSTGYFNKTTDLNVSGDFTAVLAKILRQMGGTVYRPDGTAELRVTLSNAFAAPQTDQIRVRAEECRSFPDKTPTEWEECALLTGYRVAIDGRTITITGFDYIANAVYKDDIGLHGSRLVVEIPLTWSKTSGKESIIVKDTKAPSGVYFDGAVLEEFNRPSVTFTEDTYTVMHQREDGTTAGETTHRILSGRTDDLTTKVSSGYLYGGLESGTSFANGGSAVSFYPTPGETYTIREVPDTYLRPYVYSVWRESGAQKTVTGLCLLTTIDDDTTYRSVGFALGKTREMASLCGTVTVKEGSTVTDRLVVVDGTLNSDKERASTGQIGYHVLDGDEFTRFQSTPLTFQPYWVTNDGIRVTGPTVWTCTHRGAGTDTAYEFVKITPQTGATATKWVGTAP